MRLVWSLLILGLICVSGCAPSAPPKSTDTGSSGVSELEPEPETKE